MISIRRYLALDQTTAGTLLQLARLLMEGLECPWVDHPPPALVQIRESAAKIRASLECELLPDDLLTRAAEAMEALKQHNRGCAEEIQRPLVELHTKVRLLTEAIESIAGGSSQNINHLKQLRTQLLETREMKDVQLLRVRLSQYLGGVLKEAERQCLEADRANQQLQGLASRVNPPDSPVDPADIDSATGMGARRKAEASIAQCCQEENDVFIVIIVINQVEQLSQKLGQRYGDVILRNFATALREQVPAVDQLFRWTGPTVVALMRHRNAHDVRQALEPVLLQRLVITMEEGKLRVPVSSRWTILPLMASPRLLFHKMDAFAAAS